MQKRICHSVAALFVALFIVYFGSFDSAELVGRPLAALEYFLFFFASVTDSSLLAILLTLLLFGLVYLWGFSIGSVVNYVIGYIRYKRK